MLAIVKKIGKIALFLSNIPNAILFIVRRKRDVRKIIENCDQVILDMDGSLLTTHTFREGLKLAYGEKEQLNYDELFLKFEARPEIVFDALIMLNGLNLLINGKLTKKKELILAKNSEKKINPKVINLLKKMNKKVVLITKSSNVVAKHLSKKLGFYGGFGSVMTYNKKGEINGAKVLVTNRTTGTFNGLKFISKEDIARKIFKNKFNFEKTIVISNDLQDMEIMKKAKIAIMVSTKKPHFLDKVVEILKLYDIRI